MLSGTDLWSHETLSGDPRGGNFSTQLGGYMGTPNSLFGALETNAAKYPDKPAVVLENGDSYTFSQLKLLSDDLADRLVQVQFSKGSKIGLLLDNSIELFVALYAISKIGAVAVMLPGKIKSAALSELVTISNPDLIIAEPDRIGHLDGFKDIVTTMKELESIRATRAKHDLPLLKEDELSLMMFTSGTTSAPKAVGISNSNIIQAAKSYERLFGLDESDKLIFGVPLYHVTGVVAVIAQVTLTGCTLYLQRRFQPEKFLEWASEVQATYIHASPTVFELLLRVWPDRLDIPSIRILACGAASMPSSRILRLKEKLPSAEFRTIYGLTETTSPACIFPVDASSSEKIGASGWVIPGVDIRIINEEGVELPCNEVGEISVRGSTVCLGYINADGRFEYLEWLSTGDLGYLDGDGYLYVVDRKKDQINRGGEKIYPHEVEEAINNIEGVVDACVVGIDDELYGEIPGAVYVASKEISLELLKAELKNSLASYSIPQELCRVEEIPKTAGLKTDRKAVRKMLNRIRTDS